MKGKYRRKTDPARGGGSSRREGGWCHQWDPDEYLCLTRSTLTHSVPSSHLPFMSLFYQMHPRDSNWMNLP